MLGHENFIIWFAKIGILQMQHKTKELKAWYEEDDLSTNSRKALFVQKENCFFHKKFGWVSVVDKLFMKTRNSLGLRNGKHRNDVSRNLFLYYSFLSVS